MRVLITGGAGFIGSHLAEALLARGDEVYILDNLLTGKKENVPDHPNCTFCIGDAEYDFRLRPVFEEFSPDVVFHAAASYSDPKDWVRDLITNAIGTAQVARLCLKYNVKRLIYPETALCYGPPQQQPIQLDHPINPVCSYAISKTAGELYIRRSGVPYQIFRMANIYGPRNLSGPIPTFYKKIKAGEKCTVADTRRDFIFIDDYIECILKSVDMVGDTGIYHLASGEDYPIDSIYRVIESLLPEDGKASHIKRGPDDVETISLDPIKTIEAFQWRPKTGIFTGLCRTITWYDEHGVGDTYTHLEVGK